MGIPPETKDPVLLHHPTRESGGYFGGVRRRDGKFVYQREAESFNAVSFWTFLKKLRRASARARRRVVVIADNARYHHARLHRDGRTQQRRCFRLDFLPPYSPDLNPIEPVWKLTRRRCLHNRYFATLHEVILAVEVEFANWITPNHTLRRLCALT
jgi:transposase